MHLFHFKLTNILSRVVKIVTITSGLISIGGLSSSALAFGHYHNYSHYNHYNHHNYTHPNYHYHPIPPSYHLNYHHTKTTQQAKFYYSNEQYSEIISSLFARNSSYYRALPNTISNYYNWSCVVTEVYNGDTFNCKFYNTNTKSYFYKKVYLYGVDAPEAGQLFSSNSRQWLEHQIIGKRIKLIPFGVDKRDRIIATVFTDGMTNLNFLSVQTGNSFIYLPTKNQTYLLTIYNQQMELAKQHKLGLWNTTNQMSIQNPYCYRHTQYHLPTDSIVTQYCQP